jgi:anti-sigma-K factor RskA
VTHDEIRELLAVHALHAVDEEESQEIEGHLEDCDDCRAEVDGHRSVAAFIGAQSVEVDVPHSLWSRVEAELLPAVTPIRRNRVSLLAAVGAAAAMFVLVVVQTARLGDVRSELLAAEMRLTQVEQAMAQGDWSAAAAVAAGIPDARSVTLTGDGRAVITLLPDGTGFITESDLVELPSDRTYQLWIVQDGEVVSAGLLRRGATGSTFRFDPASLEGLVVTEEEAAGVVTSEGPAVAAWFET